MEKIRIRHEHPESVKLLEYKFPTMVPYLRHPPPTPPGVVNLASNPSLVQGISPENIILYGQSIGTVPTVDLASKFEVQSFIFLLSTVPSVPCFTGTSRKIHVGGGGLVNLG